MKRLFTLVAFVMAMLMSSCQYDDTMVWDKLDDHESRIAELERICKQLNTNISAMQTLVEALDLRDYITSVNPIIEDGEEVGYTINFAKSESITIYHGKDGANGKDGIDGADGVDGENGKDGADGVTPIIGVRQDSDDIYYWTLNGEWLLDEAGNKIKASGIDGKDGADGADGKDGADGADGKDGADGEDGKDGVDGENGKDGITPELKIEEDHWWVSTDGGLTWTKLGKAKGEDGVNYCEVFKGVTEDDNYVYFTLADDSTIAVLKDKEFNLELNAEKFNYSLGYTYSFEYTITGATTATSLEVIGSNNLQPTVDSYTLKDGVATGKIIVEMPKAIVPHATVAVLASDGRSKVVMKAVHFYYEGYEDIDEGVLIITSGQALQFPKEGGALEVGVQTNISYRVEIPEEYTWLTVADTRASLREETLTFVAEPNEEYPRYAFAYIIDLADNSVAQTLYLSQVADNALLGEEVMFVDDTLKSYMIKSFDLNKDGVLSKSEALEVKSVTISKSVADLTGLEWCTNLTSLTCASNTALTELNTAPFALLETLDISSSKISAIDLSQNPRLKSLNVSSTPIAELKLENNSELVTLKCNSLSALQNTTLVLENHPYFETLVCDNSKLTKLIVSGCPELLKLYCYTNNLTELDITNSPKLTLMHCYGNNISKLDFSKAIKLRELECDKSIVRLNLSACMELNTLKFHTDYTDELREINLGSVPGITSLDLDIYSLSSDIEPYTFRITGECITSINVESKYRSGNSVTGYSHHVKYNVFESLALETPNLTTLSIAGCASNKLKLKDLPKLNTFTFDSSKVIELDLSEVTQLTTLNINMATIMSALNISNCVNLGNLTLHAEALSNLNLTHNTKLAKLVIDYAPALTALDLSNNTNLYNLTINSASSLKRLDLSNNLKISTLKLKNVPSISYLNVGENTNLIDLNPFDSSSATLKSNLTIVAPIAKSLSIYDIRTFIDVNIDGCPNLESFIGRTDMNNNTQGIRNINFNNQTKLKTIQVSCGKDVDINISNKPDLTSISLWGYAGAVTISDCPLLESFGMNGSVRGFSISNSPRLKTFNCYRYNSKSLNLSNQPLLEKIVCSGNGTMEELNVSGCPKLAELNCSSNNLLKSINMEGCSAITKLYCYSCALTRLDVSHLPMLTTLDCSPMDGDGLEKLYVSADQVIDKVTVNRNNNNVPATTEIVVVDAQ